MTEAHLVEIYRAKDALQAHLMKSALHDAGISAQVTQDLLQGAVGGIPPGWASAPAILVWDADAARASAIIRDLEKSGERKT